MGEIIKDLRDLTDKTDSNDCSHTHNFINDKVRCALAFGNVFTRSCLL